MQYTDAIYGSYEIEGVCAEIIQSKLFQRLKTIHQGGANFLVDSRLQHTRYEHSIGVMLLIRRLGGDEKEQIAALLHDISHTAFSHVIDYVLDIRDESFHEEWYETFVSYPEISSILQANGYTSQQFIQENFPLLEQPLPRLCADRVDYTLRDLYHAELINSTEIDFFLSHLSIHENRMVVTSKESARWIKASYTILNEDYFHKKENLFANQKFAELLREGLGRKLLLESDFFQDDQHIINLLEFDMYTKIKLERIRTMTDFDPAIPSTIIVKKRELNPEIIQGGKTYFLNTIPS
ncbi:HD domain-containing protein [Siphonobacter sp. SORGH_AS_1065]|uniref:HD domain-containing protein n=1 Tax=Siphonobacter sp. SORGH_AS_1065 TaxID=3041795 RepID=UPI002784B41A|nr:HD domain-containing protein [Siphonobacter sp. SORGH_AS_1065]MDQ1086023.1 HD superfamily phosphohydrolase [Siphonobacter sp. SORGH_AS_1065]